MISLDTNILFHAVASSSDHHERARDLIQDLCEREDVVLCELALAELYVLLRHPKLLARPLSPAAAVEVCEGYRRHPLWRLVECGPVMTDVWRLAAQPGFARSRIYDARLALTLRHHGVTELLTRNVKHFEGFGFDRVLDPFASP